MENAVKVKPVEKKELIIKPEEQQQMVQVWTKSLDQLTKSQNFNLTPTERNFATSIIYGLVDRCTKDKIDIRNLNLTNFLEQVKHRGKLQLSLAEKELYLDIRNNSATGMKDVTISLQYQAIQKIMARWSTKKISRFKDGIVCKGDTFAVEEDFNDGLTKITKHVKNENIDRSNLQNIEKAYAIAYVEDGNRVVPYVKIIDRHRIMTAYNCSPSKDKNVWNKHTERMVIKTAYWCLYNDIMKPFVEIPSDMQTSFSESEDKMIWDAEPQVSEEMVDMDTSYTTTAEPTQEVDGDFESYLDSMDEQEDTAEVVDNSDVKTVYYSEYKNNKEKYNLVAGSYDAVAKTCKVTLK